ncbi:MAG: hypothetical protein FJ146_18450 [Deltaproteobacteria bacterium]|nr:hypothetical protein [Deltaproteobacteria bacterium]
MLTKRSSKTSRAVVWSVVSLCLSLSIAIVSCSSPEPAKINPVTGGGRGAITNRPAREDLAVMVNGKQWDGLTDINSLKYQVVGE